VNALRWVAVLLVLELAAAAVFCGGCVPRGVTSLPDEALSAIEAGVDGWRAAGLPECDLGAVTVRYAAYPCASVEAGCVEQGAIVLRDGQAILDSTGGPVLHEWLHLARHRCGGGRDPGHTDPRVWSAAGGATSAQGRAKALLVARGQLQ
jgi:hypothetical protein